MNLPLGSYRMTDRCGCASPKEITVSFPMYGGICQTGDVMIPLRGRDRVSTSCRGECHLKHENRFLEKRVDRHFHAGFFLRWFSFCFSFVFHFHLWKFVTQASRTDSTSRHNEWFAFLRRNILIENASANPTQSVLL